MKGQVLGSAESRLVGWSVHLYRTFKKDKAGSSESSKVKSQNLPYIAKLKASEVFLADITESG